MAGTDDSHSNIVEIDEAELKSQGFTHSGSKRFSSTVTDYAEQLRERATHRGDADKAPGMDREITHDHVRASAHSMAKTFGKPSKSRWLIATQVGEYIATAVAGVGGGHLDKSLGILAFGIGVSIAVILVVVRLTQNRE